jgi:hypothetical protein
MELDRHVQQSRPVKSRLRNELAFCIRRQREERLAVVQKIFSAAYGQVGEGCHSIKDTGASHGFSIAGESLGTTDR